MHKDLIYDVGVGDGNDTEFYLGLGFRVVAVEANPASVEALRLRFSKAESDGQLSILHVAIGPQAGERDFWINDEVPEWSSFIPEIASRGRKCHSLKVEFMPFQTVIERYGVPYYLKVDIEAAEQYVIQGLDKNHLPAYISVEANALESVYLLWGLGYNAFKIVDQINVYGKYFGIKRHSNEGVWNFLYKRALIRNIERFERKILGRAPWKKEKWNSGPFGEAAAGEWLCFEHTVYNLLHKKFGYARRGDLDRNTYYDVHATKIGDAEFPCCASMTKVKQVGF